MAFAEPRTCNAYSMANTGSSTSICHSLFFKLTATPESILKLKGPTICNKYMVKVTTGSSAK